MGCYRDTAAIAGAAVGEFVDLVGDCHFLKPARIVVDGALEPVTLE